jgi:hypothetical protein
LEWILFDFLIREVVVVVMIGFDCIPLFVSFFNVCSSSRRRWCLCFVDNDNDNDNDDDTDTDSDDDDKDDAFDACLDDVVRFLLLLLLFLFLLVVSSLTSVLRFFHGTIAVPIVSALLSDVSIPATVGVRVGVGVTKIVGRRTVVVDLVVATSLLLAVGT